MLRPLFVERRSASSNSPILFSTVLHRLFERRWRGHETEGGAGQGKARHGRHDFSRGGARPGSLRPIAGARDGRPRWPSTSRRRLVSANGRRCSTRQRRYGKRFTGMRPQPDRRRPRRSNSPGAATWTMRPRSRWSSRATWLDRGLLPTTSRRTFPRIRRCNTCICQRFERLLR